MILFLACLCGVCLYRICFKDNYDYLELSQSNAIKGIMAFLIFCSHIRQYITLGGGVLDQSYRVILNAIGQLSVAMFFFYSGYGIFFSYQNKEGYFRNFLRKRFLKTLIHFDLAVILFLIIDIVIGRQYSLFDYIFCWIGWTSIGNSNWYMFVMLAVYIIAYLAMRVCYEDQEHNNALLVTKLVGGFTFCFATIMFLIKGSDSRWYTTVLCFPTGFFFALYKDKIDLFLEKKSHWVMTVIVSSVLFCSLYYLKHITRSDIPFSFMSCVFSCLLCFILKKIRINNSILQFLGIHSFSFFILQRIPMIVISNYNIIQNRYIFFLVCHIITLIIAAGFDRLCSVIDSKCFK